MKIPQSLLDTVSKLKGRRLIITVNNAKGGVGKTNVSFHTIELLRAAGLVVLAVDNDPQCNFTTILNGMEQVSEDYLEQANMLTAASIYEDALTANYKLYTQKEGLFILPGTTHLEDIDKYDQDAALNPYEHLPAIMERHNIDICVIDTPPTNSVRTLGSQVVADVLFMPMELDAFSADGVIKVNERLGFVCDQLEIDRKPFYLLPNRCNPRTKNFKVMMDELNSTGLFVAEPITQRTPIGIAASEGIPVWEFKDSNSRTAAKNLLAAFDGVFGEIA